VLVYMTKTKNGAKVKLNYVGNTNYYSDYRILASLAARDLAKTWH